MVRIGLIRPKSTNIWKMKPIRLFVILLFVLFINNPGILAQQSEDKKAIMKAIETMFDGMRAGDSSMVSSVFRKDAIMKTIGRNSGGDIQLFNGSLNRFLQAVGTPHDQVWDERIANVKIKVDGDLGHAWVPYSFYLGEKFSHCGVNSFQFFREKEGWKAFFIVDTRRPDNCLEDL